MAAARRSPKATTSYGLTRATLIICVTQLTRPKLIPFFGLEIKPAFCNKNKVLHGRARSYAVMRAGALLGRTSVWKRAQVSALARTCERAHTRMSMHAANARMSRTRNALDRSQGSRRARASTSNRAGAHKRGDRELAHAYGRAHSDDDSGAVGRAFARIRASIRAHRANVRVHRASGRGQSGEHSGAFC